MKKTKKALASLAIAGMVLTMVPFNAFATGTVPTRLAGTTAAQTAVEIADQTGWTGTAILASSASYGMVDALTSGPLAAFSKAPILLQEPGAVLNADTKAELTKLNVKKVYVTSGTAVISKAVLEQLAGMNITVESLGGADRFETSVNIAKKMVALGAPVTKVAAAYGWLNQDALSIAAIASASNSPILLTEKNAVPASVKAFLANNAGVISSDVIGGTGVISDAVKAALTNATRHAGNTAYDTNNQVIQDFASSLTFGNVYVASGVTGIDALAGAPLAAASKSAIVLTDGVNVPAVATFVHSKLAVDSVVTALGGTAVVPENIRVGISAPQTGEFSVTSVSGINSHQAEITFNKAVDPASLFANTLSGAFVNSTVALSTIDGMTDGTLTGLLSADGKTLIVTSTNAFSKRYIVVVDNLKATDGKTVTKYNEVVTIAADITPPTIIGTERLNASQVKVKFSEPLQAMTPSFKYADDTAVTNVTGAVVAGANEVIFTMDENVTVNKEIIATFIGAQDQAGNLLTPNPATVSFLKGTKDGVAPIVSSITQTGSNTFSVKFSEQLLDKPVVKIGNAGEAVAVSADNIVKDTTDATKYNVTAPATLGEVTTVAVESFIDLSGEAGTAMSKVVTFVKDTVAPKVVSSVVTADGTDRKEYLEITFDKDVVLATPTVATTSGSYVKDYITTTLANIASTPVDYKTASDKKVVRVGLATFLTGADVKGATYTLNLTFAGITNGAAATADTTTTTFTRGEDGVASNTDVVGVVSGSVAKGDDNNKVIVIFDKAVDGASAINVANYRIDGVVVDSVTLLPYGRTPATATQQAVIVNLKANSNGFTGVRNINIANVKALGSSKAMTPYFTNTVSLNENVAPTVTSASLTGTSTITLTFSEAVKNAVADSRADFELRIGGQKVATNATMTTADQTTAGNTLVLTLQAPVTADDLSKGLSVVGLTTIDVQDAAGNTAVVSAPVAVQ